MAASRTPSAPTADAIANRTASRRISFAKIHEPLEVPDLLGLQTESFDWLLGNDDVAGPRGRGRSRPVGRTFPRPLVSRRSSRRSRPIEDFGGSMSLSFREHRFEPPKYTAEECKEKDFTFAAPLFVTAEFVNYTTGEIKSQTVFMGDFPLMTERGTFIINGTERVVVSQLVRSPGVYFERTADKTSDKDILTAKVIPSRGAWLEFEIDKRDNVGVRVDRKRKQNATVLLKALGMTDAEIREEFARLPGRHRHPGEGPRPDAGRGAARPLPQDPPGRAAHGRGRPRAHRELLLQPEALRPREGRPLQAEQEARPGRAARGLGPVASTTSSRRSSTSRRCTSTCPTLPGTRAGESVEIRVETDDIDHFGNRRIRAVGELIQNQVRTGLSRMERVVRERMTTQDVEAITPQTLINIRPVVASIKEFFGTSQLSQFMDQNNPLAGLTHKRRLSALGPGGLSRDRAGMEVRDVHPSHYGRMCPIETPEGPNIGLIGSLATYGRINPFGFVETPYRKVIKGKVTDEVHYLTADDEDRHVIAQANAPLKANGAFEEDRVLVRVKGGEIEYVAGEAVDYMDVSPRQMVSVATALIPFLEHDDANRALMGANMQRQAVPLVRSEAPLVGTGMERRAAIDAGDVIVATKPGVVTEVSADLIVVANDDATTSTYRVAKFRRSNQGTSYNQRVLVDDRRPRRGRLGPRRRPGHGQRRARARPQPAGRVHVVGGPQLRGRDHPVAAPRAGRRALLDPHRGARGRRARHQARPGGDHAGHPERLRGGPRGPRRARHHPHRCRGRAPATSSSARSRPRARPS